MIRKWFSQAEKVHKPIVGTPTLLEIQAYCVSRDYGNRLPFAAYILLVVRAVHAPRLQPHD